MINRIRDIRRQKGMTLADVAAACVPATTAQTIGRLETGMRNLSLVWMNRIAAALDVEPELLVRGQETPEPKVIAKLGDAGVEALTTPRDAILPIALAGDATTPLVALAIEASAGEYRVGDHAIACIEGKRRVRRGTSLARNAKPSAQAKAMPTLSNAVDATPATASQNGGMVSTCQPRPAAAAVRLPVASVTCLTSSGNPKKSASIGVMPSSRPSATLPAIVEI